MIRHGMICTAAGILLTGYTASPGRTARSGPAVVEAVYADARVVVDGRLDDPVWAAAPVYAMTQAAGDSSPDHGPTEEGQVRFAWDADYFYLAVDFADSDVVAEGGGDGELHFQKGDVAELFLWSDAHPWYWELYVTPHARQSSFFFPSAGRMLPSTYSDHLHMAVGARVQGSLNVWTDRDDRWTAEMAVPVTGLTARGEAWGPDASWRLLVGRYNYSAHLSAPELSCMPGLSHMSFHLRHEYSHLKLVPSPARRPQADAGHAQEQ